MTYPSTASTIAAVSAFAADLKGIGELLDQPRDALLRHLQTLQASLATIETAITLALEGRDRAVERLDAMEQAVERLEKQVRVMQAELLALQARVERLDGGNDLSAPRH